jgi:hypothetical protein
MLDSVVFRTAGWGIANPWSEFYREDAVPIPAQFSGAICVPFTIPADVPRHGCFRVSSFPRFGAGGPLGHLERAAASGLTAPAAFAGGQSNDRQINRDSRDPCSGFFVPQLTPTHADRGGMSPLAGC